MEIDIRAEIYLDSFKAYIIYSYFLIKPSSFLKSALDVDDCLLYLKYYLSTKKVL